MSRQTIDEALLARARAGEASVNGLKVPRIVALVGLRRGRSESGLNVSRPGQATKLEPAIVIARSEIWCSDLQRQQSGKDL